MHGDAFFTKATLLISVQDGSTGCICIHNHIASAEYKCISENVSLTAKL